MKIGKTWAMSAALLPAVAAGGAVAQDSSNIRGEVRVSSTRGSGDGYFKESVAVVGQVQSAAQPERQARVRAEFERVAPGRQVLRHRTAAGHVVQRRGIQPRAGQHGAGRQAPVREQAGEGGDLVGRVVPPPGRRYPV